jgi:curli biogenesis system outer membrane secretion channel CsgG
MQNTYRLFGIILLGSLISGCAARTVVKEKQANSVVETPKVESKYTGPRRRIGVVNFENKAPYAQARIGNTATDILITELVKSGKFIVVERDKMDKILEEQKLGQGVAPCGVAPFSSSNPLPRL